MSLSLLGHGRRRAGVFILNDRFEIVGEQFIPAGVGAVKARWELLPPVLLEVTAQPEKQKNGNKAPFISHPLKPRPRGAALGIAALQERKAVVSGPVGRHRALA
ncbi:hypothetical protein HML84_21725 [Alcanivorax sp. IO_7]|nr:hypothetical protein HML84_21725 [Alcanivorax sp. IO_7]